MRLLLIFCVLCLFLNCEDKKSKKKNTIETIETNEQHSNDLKEDSAVEDTTKFPVLNDANAMEFFLQYDRRHKENKVRLTTDFGAIEILLYNDTKFHRSNFIYLIKRHYFDGTQFYRVINNFIVQAGNSDDKKTARKREKIGRYLLPTDTKKGYKHDRGVISMPSSEVDNPHKLASPFEFFIIQQQGGAHFLNGDYTIFGEVTKGMDVVDKIASVKTDEADWPLQNIFIRKAEIID